MGTRVSDTMRAWERFVSGEPLEQFQVRDVVSNSWGRCRNSNLNPRTDAAPRLDFDGAGQLRRQNRKLLLAAATTLADATDALTGTGSLMLLADANGVVLETVGDQQTIHAGIDIALTGGGQWDEGHAGTNGIGTALAIGHPVMVHAAEHYCEGIKSWSCAGAPIRDPFHGGIVGLLDISACRQSSSAPLLALATMAAKQIEQHLTRQIETEHLHLLERGLEHSQRFANDGLIAVDSDGRILYVSPRVPRMLRERYDDSWPELRRGVRILDPRAGRATLAAGLPDLPREWLKPLMVDGEVSGHLLVIPAQRGTRPASRSRQTADEADIDRSRFDGIVGVSQAIRTAIGRAQQIAAIDVPVLIEGETGVGKELFARAIHGESSVASKPFIVFNCGAVSKELLASELFGYVKGAFTSASTDGRIGRFEEADGGTLCLDEIGELQLDLQPYLLRILEEGVVYRVGDNIPRKIHVRLLATTNRDLREEVDAGRFRLDLYHRLNIISIKVPPLRDRIGDLEYLIEYFNARIAEKHHRSPVRLTKEAMSALREYAWPGNVRELRNVMERAILFAVDGVTDVDCLPQEISQNAISPPASLKLPLGLAERQTIEKAVLGSGGNLSTAAALLGISRSTLYRKMSQYGLKRAPLTPPHPTMPVPASGESA